MNPAAVDSLSRRMVLLAIALGALAGCSHQRAEEYQFVSAEDAAMNEAIEKARSTADDFLQAFRERKPDSREFYVKRAFCTPDGGQEHMWVEILTERNGALTGRVANDPEETFEVELGDVVGFDISEISDWKYIQGKKLIGGYTIRYFIEKMSPEQRKAFLEEAGFEL